MNVFHSPIRFSFSLFYFALFAHIWQRLTFRSCSISTKLYFPLFPPRHPFLSRSITRSQSATRCYSYSSSTSQYKCSGVLRIQFVQLFSRRHCSRCYVFFIRHLSMSETDTYNSMQLDRESLHAIYPIKKTYITCVQ